MSKDEIEIKKEFYFYKSWYSKPRIIDLFPILSISKNVQGYSFIRTFSLNWFTYAISFFLIKRIKSE